MFKLDLKGRGTRYQIVNIHWIIEKAEEFQKNVYICFIDYAKAFDRVGHSKLCKILQEMGIPDHLPDSWEKFVQVKKKQLKQDMEQWTGSKLGKEYIMRNTGLDESQAGINIAGRHTNYLRYADDTILMAESEEELMSLLMKVKDESKKAGLKLIQKTKIMASGPITSWEIDGETGKQCQTLFFWAPKSLQMVIAAMKLKDAYSLERKLWPT